MIEGRAPNAALLDLELGDGRVSLHAAKLEERDDGVLFEIRPRQRDPDHVVSRTIRALWRIAVGALWLGEKDEALKPQWDPLRCGIHGYPFVGYLLSRPFVAARSREIKIHVAANEPASPVAVTFAMGGVAFAAPLLAGVPVKQSDVEAAGWEVHASDAPAPQAIHLWLDTTYEPPLAK